MLTTSEDDFAEMPQDPLVETEKASGPKASGASGEESFEPELMRLQVAKKLFKKAIATYELLLMSQDPKIRKEVAKDILEVVGAKAPKGQQQGGNIQIALFPPEYVAKVAQGLSKFQQAEVIDVEGVQVYETSLSKPLLGDSSGSDSGSGLSGSDS